MDESLSDKQAAKRKRVTKACLVCAKSRRKCDGQQPFCGTCKTQGLTCTWSEVPSRRGPPKGYRRGNADPASLAPKIAKIREHVQALQVAYGDRFVLDQLHKSLFGDHPCTFGIEAEVEMQSSSTSTTVSSSAMRRYATLGAASDNNSRGVRTRSDCSQEEQDDPVISDVDEGSSSGIAFYAKSMKYIDTNSNPMKFNPWGSLELEHDPIVRGHSSAVSYSLPYSLTPAQIELLLKIYWSKIHPHWPILYKPAFDAVSIFRIQDEFPRVLLYSLFCLSAHLVSTAGMDAKMADTFRCIAEEELQGEGAFRSDINTCTALFLLSLHYHGEGKQRQAWIHCSVAAMMALDLGLHKSVKGLPLIDHETRVRVFWNIFVYEKVLACEMGRPVMIRIQYCDPTRLSEEQTDEYETAVHPGSSRYGHTVRLYTISIFNAAVDLFRVFERILSEVHSVPKSTFNRTARERLVYELEHEVESWQRSLSTRCKYPHPDDRTPTRSLYLVHAWYHVAIILLHRPLIHWPRMGHNFTSNSHHKKATDHANRLVDLLAQFAKGQEIEKLPPNDAYLIFTAANIHVFNLTVNDRTCREQARPRLEQCIEWLRGLAETWSAASQYKKLLDAFSQVASKTIISYQSFSFSPSAVDSTTPNSGSSGTPSPHTHHTPQAIGYSNPNSLSYIMHHNSGQITDAASATSSSTQLQPAPLQQQPTHPQQQQMYTAETEQKFATPELFSLENYYWNDFQTSVNAGQQPANYYQQPQTNGATLQAPGGLYYDVLRLIQEENRQG